MCVCVCSWPLRVCVRYRRERERGGGGGGGKGMLMGFDFVPLARSFSLFSSLFLMRVSWVSAQLFRLFSSLSFFNGAERKGKLKKNICNGSVTLTGDHHRVFLAPPERSSSSRLRSEPTRTTNGSTRAKGRE